MTARPYFVHGVALVGVDGLCECCEKRPAIGRSISGISICQRCAGWAAWEAEELAREKQESAARRQARIPALRAAVARSEAHADAQSAVTVIGKNTVALVHGNSRAEQKRRARARCGPSFHCGHQRTAANTYTRGDGRRVCRECRRLVSTETKRKARERVANGTRSRTHRSTAVM